MVLENSLNSPVADVSGLEVMFACASVCTVAGVALPWVDELGVFILRSRTFKYSLDHAQKSFYRSANYIFGKVGRIASGGCITVNKQ